MEKLKLLIACLAVCALVISVLGCITSGKEKYRDEYMSFEYPKEWNVTGIEDYGSHGESVTLKSSDNQSVSIIHRP